MCKFEELGVPWPPCGWEQLGDLEKTYGQSIIKDPATARVAGVTYVIEPIPVYLKDNSRIYVYSLKIDGWEYTIQNDSREYPVLSFMFRDRPDKTISKNFYISDIKSQARPVIVTERSAHRAMMAALFLIKQISSNLVPDVERILRLYKIHPTQRSLYEIDDSRADSLYCGSPYVCVEREKKIEKA